ncbi:MAG: colanic acid biosynthesis glycosyltransferase WcaL, partial [Tabrizicola sp.]|nr:colanic acid biosynthesis glycosyltransferase WcaL [Tabrizicola sp.]
IPELVEDGQTGWLVPAGNVDALAQALKQALAAPPAQLADMGRAGIARARARHHIDTEAGKLLRFFGGASP